MINQHSFHSNYDSSLDIQQFYARLNINYWINLVPLNQRSNQHRPDVRNGILYDRLDNRTNAYPLNDWFPNDWNQFCLSVSSTIQRAWNDRLWLIPDRPWFQRNPNGPLIRLPVKCCIHIHALENIGRKKHYTFFCVDPTLNLRHGTGYTEEFRSYIYPERRYGVISRDINQVSISNVALPMNLTTNHLGDTVASTPAYIKVSQIGIAHEFGHILGLEHVAVGTPACRRDSDTNRAACYGTTAYEIRDIEGSGMSVRNVHARPWLTAIRRHVNTRGIHWTSTDIQARVMEFFDPY